MSYIINNKNYFRVTQTTVSSFSPQLQNNRPASNGDYDVTAAYDATNSKVSRDSTEITVNFLLFQLDNILNLK